MKGGNDVKKKIRQVRVSDAVTIGDGGLVAICGPCVIEDRKKCLDVAAAIAEIAREAGIPAPDPAPSGGGTIPPIPRFDSNPERIRVDSDGLVGGTLLDVGFGQTVSNLVGPLDYTFRTYSDSSGGGPALRGQDRRERARGGRPRAHRRRRLRLAA